MIKTLKEYINDSTICKEHINPCYSPMGHIKKYNIYLKCMDVLNINGYSAEVGVFGGETSYTISNVLKTKHFAYDTYNGIISSTDIDYHNNGEFKCELSSVQDFIGENHFIIYKKGIFPNTFEENNQVFKLVHIDTDTYLGTLHSLYKFLPLLVKKGYIILDDFNWIRCQGVDKAVYEIFDTLPQSLINNKKYKIHQNKEIYEIERNGNQLFILKL